MLRQRCVLLQIAVLALVQICCNNKDNSASPENRQATVSLQDGKHVTGTVKASSSKEITIAGDDGITRTIPMNQVNSVAYTNRSTPPLPGAGAGASPSAAGTPEQTPPPTRTVEIPAGTEIAVRSTETIDSSKAADGQQYAAVISKDVLDSSGTVAIPQGSNAQLTIVSASGGGRIRGASDLVLTLGSVTVGGQNYEVDAGKLLRSGRPGMGRNKRTAEFTGGGAALGAIIGAIAGGGKGAAIGAGAGGGGGALTQILTKGKAVQVPVESLLTFKLDKPLQIEEN